MKLHKLIRTYERSSGAKLASLTSCTVVLLILAVTATPFPYGSILPGGMLRVEMIAFLAAAAAFGSTPRTSGRMLNIRPALLMLLAIALLGLVQVAPLGSAIVGALSPSSSSIYDDATTTLSLFGAKDLPVAKISVAPQETLNAVLLTLAYAALFCAAAITLNSRTLRRVVLGAVVLGAVIQVVVGVTTAPSLTDRIHGSFVNPNHLAAYCEMGLALTFALIWLMVVRGADRAARTRNRAEKFERRILPVIPPLLLWGFIGGGLALTRSRGGVLAVFATTFILIALVTITWKRRDRPGAIFLTVGGGVVAGMAFVVMSTGSAAVARLLASDPNDLGSDTRLRLWQFSIEAWRDFPIFGSGLGAFRDAFRRVQPRDLSGLVEYAHNDALQMLVSGGAIGLVLSIAAVVWTFVRLVRGWTDGSRREESAVILGAMGALLTIILHGVVEFNLSIPAIPATLAVIAGAGLAAARKTKTADREGPPETGYEAADGEA